MKFSNDWKTVPFTFPTIGTLCLLVLMGLFPTRAVYAAEIQPVREATLSDIESARKELAAQRERIAAERIALTGQLAVIQEEVRTLRAQWQQLQQASVRRESQLARDRQRAEATNASLRSFRLMLLEYRRTAEQYMSISQLQRYADLLRDIDVALEKDEQSGITLSAAVPASTLALRLMWKDLSPATFNGYALDEQGYLHDGRYLALGPISLFWGTESDINGFVSSGGVEPLLMNMGSPRAQRALSEWIAGEADTFPLDVSSGALIKIVEARPNLMERLQQGGIVMIPLFLIGILCVGVGLQRYIALRRMETDVDPVLNDLLSSLRVGDEEAARAVAETTSEPWRSLWRDAVMHWRSERAYLEEILQDRIVMQGPRITQYLGVLAMGAAAAPLLGLLGTVTGMIHTFQLITVFGTGDARSLSGGISEALITTQVGLIIAVPALLAHAYLMRRAKGIISELEQAAIRFIRQLPTGSKNE